MRFAPTEPSGPPPRSMSAGQKVRNRLTGLTFFRIVKQLRKTEKIFEIFCAGELFSPAPR